MTDSVFLFFTSPIPTNNSSYSVKSKRVVWIGRTEIKSSGYNSGRSISCKVGDMIAMTGFISYTPTPSISGGTLQGSWRYRDVGGSTYLVCGIIKATSTTVTVGTNDVSWIAKISDK